MTCHHEKRAGRVVAPMRGVRCGHHSSSLLPVLVMWLGGAVRSVGSTPAPTRALTSPATLPLSEAHRTRRGSRRASSSTFRASAIAKPALGVLSPLCHLSSDRPISSSACCRTAHRPPTGSAAAGRVSYATRACRRRLPARCRLVRACRRLGLPLLSATRAGN